MILAIVQARMGSTRLPGKVMININGMPVIKILCNRLSKSKYIDKIVVATGQKSKNSDLIEFMKTNEINFTVGSEVDVLERFTETAGVYNASVIVRITSDCPFSDPNLIDEVIEEHLSKNNDYTSNIDPATFPDGLDIEVFNYDTLLSTFKKVSEEYDKEHVTPFMRNNPEIRKSCLKNNVDLSNLRWTLDTSQDLKIIEEVFNHFYPSIDFSWGDILDFYSNNKDKFKVNSHLNRNYNTQ